MPRSHCILPQNGPSLQGFSGRKGGKRKVASPDFLPPPIRSCTGKPGRVLCSRLRRHALSAARSMSTQAWTWHPADRADCQRETRHIRRQISRLRFAPLEMTLGDEASRYIVRVACLRSRKHVSQKSCSNGGDTAGTRVMVGSADGRSRGGYPSILSMVTWRYFWRWPILRWLFLRRRKWVT